MGLIKRSRNARGFDVGACSRTTVLLLLGINAEGGIGGTGGIGSLDLLVVSDFNDDCAVRLADDNEGSDGGMGLGARDCRWLEDGDQRTEWRKDLKLSLPANDTDDLTRPPVPWLYISPSSFGSVRKASELRREPDGGVSGKAIAWRSFERLPPPTEDDSIVAGGVSDGGWAQLSETANLCSNAK